MLPPSTMQVWALRNPDGSFRGKFHRHDSYDCKGRRMYEETYADKDDYVLVDLRELASRQGACQFECCFQGLTDAGAVAGRYVRGEALPPTAKTARATPSLGISSGQTVVFQDLASGQTKTRAIVSERRAEPSRDETSSESPIGRALVGREVGDIVLIDLPRGSVRVQVLEVRTAT
jgi:hypothetical protein